MESEMASAMEAQLPCVASIARGGKEVGTAFKEVLEVAEIGKEGVGEDAQRLVVAGKLRRHVG